MIKLELADTFPARTTLQRTAVYLGIDYDTMASHLAYCIGMFVGKEYIL